MEKELSELRAQLSKSQQASPITTQYPPIKNSTSTSVSPTLPHMQSSIDQYIGSQEAVASLLDLRSGLEGGSYLRGSNGNMLPSRRLEGVTLGHERVRQLFYQSVMSLYSMLSMAMTDPYIAFSRSTTLIFPCSTLKNHPMSTTKHLLSFSGSSLQLLLGIMMLILPSSIR